MLDKARAAIAGLAGTTPENVYFTSGATEANNWVLRGACARQALVSAIEHPSVLQASAGERVPVHPDGRLDLAALDAMLARLDAPALVSVMLVNNETGVIQPTRDIAEIAHRHGALVHGDGVQAAGRIPIDMAALGLDYLTLSGHKLGGPQGIGVLAVSCGISPEPWMLGGTQENRRRAGTQNVAGAVGMGVAATLAKDAITHHAELARLRDGMEAALRAIEPALVIAGEASPRVGNTSMIATPGLSAETQLMALDMEGVAVSSGAACSSGRVEPSPVLLAMGFDADLAASAIRISLGWTTTSDDIAQCLASWQKLHARHATRRTHAISVRAE
jgi:cysteine desulfurase